MMLTNNKPALSFWPLTPVSYKRLPTQATSAKQRVKPLLHSTTSSTSFSRSPTPPSRVSSQRRLWRLQLVPRVWHFLASWSVVSVSSVSLRRLLVWQTSPPTTFGSSSVGTLSNPFSGTSFGKFGCRDFVRPNRFFFSFLTSSSVESQGRTLEELEWVYQQPNPVKASQNLDKIVVQSDGTVTEKIEDDV